MSPCTTTAELQLQQPRKSKTKNKQNRSRKRKDKSQSRVPVTASNARPTFIRKMKRRSLIRWQHRLNRERPTCTERNDSLLESADGSMATVATRREKKQCFTKPQST